MNLAREFPVHHDIERQVYPRAPWIAFALESRAVHYRRLGRSGLQVSEIGLGSWLTFGSKLDRNATRAIVHRAFDLGINLFDTADVYADGEAESALGDALHEIPRRHVVIASKAWFPASDHPNDRGLSRKHLMESVESSLQRLGTDFLDLHQCHRPDPDTPIEETVCAYEDLIRQGKILYWGVSEWDATQIENACRVADQRNAYRPISNQPQYSMLRRGIESKLLDFCQREGLSQIVFSPLAQGVLSGKYAGGARSESTRAADPKRSFTMADLLQQATPERIEALASIADQLQITMAQLALAWCLRRPNVASTIMGVTEQSQLAENAAASGIRLPSEIEAQIDALFSPPAD